MLDQPEVSQFIHCDVNAEYLTQYFIIIAHLCKSSLQHFVGCTRCATVTLVTHYSFFISS